MGQTVDGAALKKLRKMYGYEMAMVRQKGHFLGDEQSELESLALHHLDKQVLAAVQEFFIYVGDAKNMDAGAIAVLMGMCGFLLAEMNQKKGKKAANSAARFGKKYLEIRYLELLGEKKNDNRS